MPFTWQISISPTGPTGTFVFVPNPLPDQSSSDTVAVGDIIHWTNYDTVPHWPGIPNYQSVFMPGPISPGNSSPGFVVDASYSGQQVTYRDTQAGPSGPTASIIISPTGPTA
jgi:hypothetical protein